VPLWPAAFPAGRARLFGGPVASARAPFGFAVRRVVGSFAVARSLAWCVSRWFPGVRVSVRRSGTGWCVSVPVVVRGLACG